MKFNASKELDKVEKELWRIGSRMSKPFHKRAKELIVRLSKFEGVTINHFIMGMGGWVLDGKLPYKEFWGPNLSKVEEGFNDFDLRQFDTGRNSWMEYYDNVNPGISAVLTELNEICEILTHTRHLAIFDINDEDMKKLLARKTKV